MRLEPYSPPRYGPSVETFAELREQETGDRPVPVEVYRVGGHIDVIVSEQHPARKVGHVITPDEVEPSEWARLERIGGLIP